MAKKYWARRSLGYGGQKLDRGQIFEIGGYRNDDKLIRLGYIEALPSRSPVHECRKCNARFMDSGCLEGHFRKRHKPKKLNPKQQDLQDKRMERMENEIAPLRLDKTKASKEVKV